MTAASSRPATRPTRSGSGKATSLRKRRSKPRRRRARPGVSSEQPTARLGGIGRPGPALAASGRRVRGGSRAKGPVAAFALSRDGTKLATAGADKVVRIWNPADGKLIKEIPLDQPVDRASRSRKTARKSPSALANKSARIYNAADGKEVKKIEGLPSPITALAFRGDGGQFAVAGEDNAIRVINAADGKTIKELKGHTGRIHALAFSPKDGNLIVSASADKTARLWDVNQGKSVRDFAGTATRCSA